MQPLGASLLPADAPKAQPLPSARLMATCRLPEGSPVRLLRCRPLPLQIATKVELYVGNLPPGSKDPEQCIMKRLGYLSFDNNERSGHQARELKSVHVSTPAFLLKLVVQRCHTNRLNIYNQVPANPGCFTLCCFKDGAAHHHNKPLAAHVNQLPQAADGTMQEFQLR